MCVRLWQQRREHLLHCVLVPQKQRTQCHICIQLFLAQDAQSCRRVLVPFASVSEMNQILSEEGNGVWCNGVEGEMGTFSPIFSVCVCVCVGNSSIPPLISW